MLVAGAAVPATAGATAGRTLYVSTTGQDFAADGWSTPANSIDAPWRTIEWAVRRAVAGDTIVVRGGTYIEAVGWGARKGTASAPIHLQNFDGESGRDQGHARPQGGRLLDRFASINVTRDPPPPAATSTSSRSSAETGWQFLDSEVWGTIGISNLMVTGSSTYSIPKNYLIAGNCIHDNNATGDGPVQDHNIYIYPGYASAPASSRNIFFNARNGSQIKAAGPTSSVGAAYLTIRYNTMVRGSAGV